MKNYWILLLLVGFFFSCNQEDSPESESVELIFGHFYGECIGEGCVETFRLTLSLLEEDRLDNYNSGPFDWEQLSQDQFEKADGLIDMFPEHLWDEEQTIGCPDCGDWGGNYIKFSIGDREGEWGIDMINESIPEYLWPFMAEVNKVIAEINE